MGLVLVLHLPVVQRLLGPLLLRVASAAAGSVVTASSLDFNLWTGHVHATGLRFIRPGLEITSASLDVQVRPRRGFVVRAIEPRVVVSLDARRSAGAAEPAAVDRPRPLRGDRYRSRRVARSG